MCLRHFCVCEGESFGDCMSFMMPKSLPKYWHFSAIISLNNSYPFFPVSVYIFHLMVSHNSYKLFIFNFFFFILLCPSDWIIPNDLHLIIQTPYSAWSCWLLTFFIIFVIFFSFSSLNFSVLGNESKTKQMRLQQAESSVPVSQSHTSFSICTILQLLYLWVHTWNCQWHRSVCEWGTEC